MTARINVASLEDVFANGWNGPGQLIAVAGFDAAGKTTQVAALGNYFRSLGRAVVETRQPSDWYRGLEIVQAFQQQGGNTWQARVLALLAAADRLRHVREVIEPALKEGSVVICDRYVYATFAVFIHRGLDAEFLVGINRGIPRPDAAFYLKTPTDILVERLALRDDTLLQFEERERSRIESITRSYDEMVPHLTVIDGAAPIHRVTEQIVAVLPKDGAADGPVRSRQRSEN